jgi:hypothetical protein
MTPKGAVAAFVPDCAGGIRSIEALTTTACHEQYWEVAIGSALLGLGSLSGWRAAVVAAHLGAAVRAVRAPQLVARCVTFIAVVVYI